MISSQDSGADAPHRKFGVQLQGKAAVITGGASGIGRASARALLDDRLAAIGLVDLREEVNDVAKELNAQAGRELALPFVGDVTDEAFRRKVFEDLNDRFGAVHLCVPAAGIARDRLAVKIDKATGKASIYSSEDFEAVVRVNLLAPIYWAMETIASVAEQRFREGKGPWKPEERAQGSIVLIGSVSSAGNRGQVSYATTKRGLEGAQATLAKEAIFYGVRCNIIHPGYTDTPMVQKLGDDFIRDNILPKTQLHRLLSPDEVAESIRFMLRSSAVSGSLWVDAGWHSGA